MAIETALPAIALVALAVYGVRFVGLAIAPVLARSRTATELFEILPVCALAAILAPAAAEADGFELAALIFGVAAFLWKNNALLAMILSLGVLAAPLAL